MPSETNGERYTGDISQGTGLIAGTSGWHYTVQSVENGSVLARGPAGPLRISESELRRDIARGNIEVK